MKYHLEVVGVGSVPPHPVTTEPARTGRTKEASTEAFITAFRFSPPKITQRNRDWEDVPTAGSYLQTVGSAILQTLAVHLAGAWQPTPDPALQLVPSAKDATHFLVPGSHELPPVHRM